MKTKKALVAVIGMICLGLGVVIGIILGTQRDEQVVMVDTQGLEEVVPHTHQIEQTSAIKIEPEEKKELNDPNEAFKYTKEMLAEKVEEADKERSDNQREWEESYLSEAKAISESYKQATGEIYLIANSNVEKITRYQIQDFSEELLAVARNEIYARQGYIFTNPIYTGYFQNKSWYVPTKKISEIQLSEIEAYNIRYLQWKEKCLEREEQEDKQVVPLEFCDMYLFNAEKPFKMDLNNDGIEEEIIFEAEERTDDLITSGVIKVNGQVKKEVSGRLQAKIWVIDIDETDNYKELIINDVGPSADPVDSYFYFDGKAIQSMGSIASEINSTTSYCRTYAKEGKLYARLSSTDTISGSCERSYEITRNHIIKEIPKDYWEIHHWVFATEPIVIYEKNDLASLNRRYEAGMTLLIVGTDLNEWMKVEWGDGKVGWVNTKELDITTLDGVGFAG